MDTLSRQAAEAGIVFQPVVKLDWAEPGAFDTQQWPVQSQMRRYLGNIRALCDSLDLAPELPESMERLTYIGANQIEQALLLAESRIGAVKNTYRFSGELIAGEE